MAAAWINDALWTRLFADIQALREESFALRVCLEDKGLVHREGYLAQLHRIQFASMRRARPCTFNTGFVDVLQTFGLGV